jgi:O-antigen/teichoic acid export membrane protein
MSRNVAWNLIGYGAPLLVALLALPILVQHLGAERFGILTLAWTIISQFGFLDLGLSPALTRLVAQRLAEGREADVPALVGTALAVVLVLGALAGLALAAATPWLTGQALRVPAGLQAETRSAFYLLALCVPIILATAALRGVLDGRHAFALANAVKVPMGAFTFLGPLLVLPFTTNLAAVLAVLVAGRVVACAAYAALCLRLVPGLRGGLVVRRDVLKPLLSFGGWVTVTYALGTSMVYLERFLIGALVSLAAVAYYAVPYEVISRMQVLPVAISGVLLPTLTGALLHEPERVARVLWRAQQCLLFALFPASLVVVALAHDALAVWLGVAFARESAAPLQWLAVGVLVWGLGELAFAAIQAAGRPDLSARLHLVELPLYCVALWWLLGAYGVVGAAVAWVARVVVDVAGLFVLAGWLVPGAAPGLRRIAGSLALALPLCALAAWPTELPAKAAFLAVVLLAYAVVLWRWGLDADERAFLRRRLWSAPAAS